MIKGHATLLLIGIFIAMAVVASVVSNKQSTEPNDFPTAPPELFPGVQATQITRIELENHALGKKVTMTKVPGGWQTIDGKGNVIQLDVGQPPRMLQILSSLRYNRIMEGSDVKAFGLADGGMYSLSFDAGRTYTLLVGNLNSDSSLAFVQWSVGTAILEVPAAPINTLFAPVWAGSASQ